MKLEYLKTQLEIVTGSQIAKVYFDRNHIVNTERVKSYPFVFWDLNSYKSVMQWTSTSQEKEVVTMKAYCFGYVDKDTLPVTSDANEKMWDSLREKFRVYLGVVNANNYISITNLASMPNELFPFGVSVDSEIAVSFDVNFNLFCNTSV